MLAALRRGLEDKDARKAAAVAVSYVPLVYGRQLQPPVVRERAAQALDVDFLDVLAALRRGPANLGPRGSLAIIGGTRAGTS